jgi:phosphatidylglycerol---prolipoprotein diacylglyceryl transferase
MTFEIPSIILHSPGPVLAQIGPLTLRWYGLLTALGFLLAVAIASKLLVYRKKFIETNHHIQTMTDDDFMNFSILILITGILGARLWYVALKWDYYSQNTPEIIQIWHGGQSIQGGIILGILCAILLSAFIPNGFRQLLFKLSLAASVMPIAQAIGRWGNFFNEEAYGIATDVNLPVKLFISKTGLFHHPTFLYEGIWNLFNFLILLALNYILYAKAKSLALYKKDLIIIASYLIIYSSGRLIIESIRTDSLMLGGLAAASALSIGMIGVGIVILFLVLATR